MLQSRITTKWFRGSVPPLKACLQLLFSYWLLVQSPIDWQLPGPITSRGVVVLGGATRASFFLTFPSISVARHYHLLFNRDNMATAASRYYSEDGRATKRQKTDGMATVSPACVSCPGAQFNGHNEHGFGVRGRVRFIQMLGGNSHDAPQLGPLCGRLSSRTSVRELGPVNRVDYPCAADQHAHRHTKPTRTCAVL